MMDPRDARDVFGQGIGIAIKALGLGPGKVDAFLMDQARKLDGLSPESFEAPLALNNSMAHVLTYPIDDLLIEGHSRLRLAIMLVQEARASGASAEAFRSAWPRDVADYIDWLETSGITAEPTFTYRGNPATQTCNFIFASEQDAIHFKFRWL